MTDSVVELACPGCRAALRIPPEALARDIRCPACDEIFQPKVYDLHPAPLRDDPLLADVVAESTEWFLLTPEGLNYGPVTRETLERWVREGRVTGDCGVRRRGDEQWRSAVIDFPALEQPAALSTASALSMSSPRAGVRDGQLNPHVVGLPAGSAIHPGPVGRASVSTESARMSPHRGPLILTLAIVGVFVQCPIFSVMAWVMGSADLEEMARGRMDPSGTSATRTGRNLGLILSLFWIIMSVIVASGVLFVVAAKAAPP